MDSFNFVGALNADSSIHLSDIYLILLAIWVYMFPAFISEQRKHHQHLAIAVLNLVLGWTVLGWAVALVWACTHVDRTAENKRSRRRGANKPLEGQIIMPGQMPAMA